MFSPHQQAGSCKIFGPAYTVQMVDARDTNALKPEKHFADGISRDSVVFISQPKNYYSACWGGLMSTRAKYLGAQGVVIDGNFRDLNEHRDLDFPVRICSPIAEFALLTSEALCKRDFFSRLELFHQVRCAECAGAIHVLNPATSSDHQPWRSNTCRS